MGSKRPGEARASATSSRLLELRDLRQDLVDDWIRAGAGTRRRVRMFLGWLARSGVTGTLHVTWNPDSPRAAPLDEDRRFQALRRLLHDEQGDPRDRLAGCLLLLYAQPLTRTAALKTTAITTTPTGPTAITLARGAVALPEPLGALALALRDQRIATIGGDGWLLAGRRAGTRPAHRHDRRRRLAACRAQSRHPPHRRPVCACV